MTTQEQVIAIARVAAEKHGHTLKDEPEQATVEFIVELYHMAIDNYRAELLKGVGEPDTHCFDTDTNTDVWSHSKDQLAAAVLAARNAALEKAAQKCMEEVADFHSSNESRDTAETLAQRIRNLKDKA